MHMRNARLGLYQHTWYILPVPRQSTPKFSKWFGQGAYKPIVNKTHAEHIHSHSRFAFMKRDISYKTY
jgi:hypothetical protein